MQASVAALAQVPGVDGKRLAALGYCFGGRAVLDLARAGSEAGIAAAVSFHGILDNGVVTSGDMSHEDAPRVLICHGDADPFVSVEGLRACEEQLRESGARWDMLVFGKVRHGFTNPAQALNTNPAFGYDERAARLSWKATQETFWRKCCCREPMRRVSDRTKLPGGLLRGKVHFRVSISLC
ncbi:unnamed protein product [Effrenium voratum]|uniref:Dienelactone hydrolase domain-containing protein n=1 Tax=Effrenium voratum TaxID=2562239 RepID=A0AA36MNM6_9DINO|nr:unnamed protein product [Effrenium voratum]